MKSTKKLGVIALIIIALIVVSVLVTKVVNRTQEPVVEREPEVEIQQEVNEVEVEKLTVVTSLYPVYIATLNVTKGVNHVDVINMLASQAGCAHDYQLTTQDMRTLEAAQVFIMNGAGLEGYLEDIQYAYPELPLVDTSEGTVVLAANGDAHTHSEEEEDDHDHDHDHDEEEVVESDDHDHDHSDNEHIWINPANYIIQVQHIADALAELDPDNAQIYADNAAAYQAEVNAIWEQYKELAAFDYSEVVLFHDSVEYLTKELDIEVAYSVAMDEDTALSAGEIATVIDLVKEHDIKVLFSEVQFEDTIANRIAEETGAQVYILDSLVTGENTLDAYLNGMQHNLEVLKTALYQ